MSDFAFEIETNQCSPIKTLLETLKGTLTNVAFNFDKEKLLIREVNKTNSIVINLELFAENFEKYNYNLKKGTIVGIKITNLYDILKSINNKNVLRLVVEKKSIKDYINVSYFDSTVGITNDYKLTQINLNYDKKNFVNVDNYSVIIKLPSVYFQKLCRDSKNIDEIVEITKENKQLQLKFEKESISKQTKIEERTDFMVFIKNEPEIDKFTNEEIDKISGKYSIKDFDKFSKCIANSTNIKIYLSNYMPMVIESDIGDLGFIQIAFMRKNNE